MSEGGCLIAAVTSGGRGYFVWLHPSLEEGWLSQVYDRAWFEQLLATVDLRPEDAIDAVPLTQSFTSTLHGISMLYPEGWTAKAATEPWTAGTSLFPFGEPRADFLYDTTLQDSLFRPSARSRSATRRPRIGSWRWGRARILPATDPITVGGASGRIGSGGSCQLAVVTTDGRGYWISLYRGDVNASNVAPYDRAWFEEVLATVQLNPEDAVD